MKFDAIIVGGGIIGCFCAYYLGQKGFKVAVVERSRLGSGTSANNFSWVNATSKTSDKAYFRLNAMGVDLYDQLAKEFGAESLGINQAGALGVVRKSSVNDYTALRKQADLLESFGYPNKWLSNRELRTLEPHLDVSDDTEAALTPSDKIVNTRAFIQFLSGRIEAADGKVFENCEALEILADDTGKLTGLATTIGKMKSKKLVIATGPDTPEALGKLTGFDGFATRFPVQKVPGLLLTTPPLENELLRHLIYFDGEKELHILPDFNGGLRIGSDDIDGMIIDDQSPENLRKLGIELLKRARAVIPQFAGEPLIDDCKLAIGVRAYPEDGKTIAGPMPGSDGLFVVATHSGITLAPAIGRLMAEVIVDGKTPDALAPFALDRLEGFA